jgi:hypothetical protein|tara:strand:- start:229 stop:522 length:294 start_codon:yes stop_codon:yes gene_type:complete
MFKTPQEFADAAKALIPTVNVSKNGYEIRTQVLEMAKDHQWSDYNAKFAGWEQTVKRDPKTGEVVTAVTMPVGPGTEHILEAAEQFYAFVNGVSSKK